MTTNKNLHKAKCTKNDEFYTRLVDVEKELQHYTEHFKNKSVLCNCNDSENSAFYQYFFAHFDELELKKLVCTAYNKEAFGYKLECTGGGNCIKTPLMENGDFRSQECLELLKSADVVVTNPPFSLFREFVDVLIKYGKKFLVIGNKNAVKNKNFFPFLKDNTVWLGYESPMEFNTPDGLTKKVSGLIRWFTNLDHKKRHEWLSTYKRYTPEKFPVFDELPSVINVNKTSDIPADYNGLMAVPITFFDRYNPDQFEILDALNHYTVMDYFGVNADVAKRHSHCCNLNGVPLYSRIVIRRKDTSNIEKKQKLNCIYK